MAYTQLIPQHTTGARVETISAGSGNHAYRLFIPAGAPDEYRLAQLDDYAKMPRRQFPVRFPSSLHLSARASREMIPGTWGFGFWNNPFGMSLGFGGTGWRLPTLPNAVWFFHASEENYLSFRAPSTGGLDTGENSARPTRPAGNGFLVQAFRSPRFHALLLLAGLAFPFSRKVTRRFLGRVIGEDGIRLSVDVTRWHSYRLDWREEGVSFEVDGVRVSGSPITPRPPLGLVIWIDNQYAAFTPEGKIGFGVLQDSEPAWLEIKEIEVT
jgi:hypothetical protein